MNTFLARSVWYSQSTIQICCNFTYFLSLSPSWSTKQLLFTQNPLSSGAMLPERFGERVLYQTKEERELKERLEAIEEQLGRFKAHEAQVR